MSFCLKETITYSATGSHPHVVIPNTFNLKEFSFLLKAIIPMIYVSVQIPFFTVQKSYLQCTCNLQCTPYSFNAGQNPSPGQRNKSPSSERPYFEFLRFSSHFQEFGYRVHKALVVKVAHFLNFSVMIADASFKFLHEPSVFLTIIDRPLKKRHKNYTKITSKKFFKSCKLGSKCIQKLDANGHKPQSNPTASYWPNA